MRFAQQITVLRNLLEHISIREVAEALDMLRFSRWFGTRDTRREVLDRCLTDDQIRKLISGLVHSGNRRLFRCDGWNHRVLKCRSGGRCEIDTSSRINAEGTSVGAMMEGLVLIAVTQRKRGILWAVWRSIRTFSVGSETSIGALAENWRRESGPPAGASPRRLWRGREREISDRLMGE
jgi:hypothetical protein